MNTFQRYVEQVPRTMQHLKAGATYESVVEYPGLFYGIAGEAGEVQEVAKKFFHHEKMNAFEFLSRLEEELGDVIWYVVAICHAYGLNPFRVLMRNVGKLEARYPNGFETGHLPDQPNEP